MNRGPKERFEDSDSQDYNPGLNQDQTSSEHISQNNQEDYFVLPLIKQTCEGDLRVEEECLQIIINNNYGTSILFICITGENYKKYAKMANVICNITDSGFLSQSVKGNQGIWIYTKPYFDSRTESVTYYILAKDVDEDPINSKLLSLVALLSSSIIYITSSKLGENSLKVLRSVSDLQQNIVSNSGQGGRNQEIIKLMPHLNWILLGSDNKQPNQNQVVNRFLVFDSSPTKKAINSLFSKKSVFWIEDSEDNNFQKSFHRISSIKQKIQLNSQVKNIKGQFVESGFIAKLLIQKLVDSITENGTIVLEEVWKQINNIAAKEAYQSAVDEYIRLYSQNFSQQEPKGEEFQQILKNMRTQTIELFDNNTNNQTSLEQKNKLLKFLENQQSKIREANLRAFQIHNLKILQEISTKIQNNFRSGKYTSKLILEQDFSNYIKKYQQNGIGLKKYETLQRFMQQFKKQYENLVMKNQQMSAKFPQVHSDSRLKLTNSRENAIQSVGARGNQSQVRRLQLRVEQLQQQLGAKGMRESMDIQKQHEQMKQQNNKMREQMKELDISRKPKSQKCCLLF